MNDTAIILKTFNKQMTEFIEDINNLFPGEKDIIVLSTFMKTIMYGKTRMIINTWHSYVTEKYYSQIDNGEIQYFLNKDYSEDLENSDNSREILEAIDKLRSTLKRAFDEDLNKEKTIKYDQNLSKLSNLYYNN